MARMEHHDQVKSACMLLLGLGFVLGVAQAADTIYQFTDENGVVHLSNVPVDSRYRPFTAAGATGAGGRAGPQGSTAGRAARGHDKEREDFTPSPDVVNSSDSPTSVEAVTGGPTMEPPIPTAATAPGNDN